MSIRVRNIDKRLTVVPEKTFIVVEINFLIPVLIQYLSSNSLSQSFGMLEIQCACNSAQTYQAISAIQVILTVLNCQEPFGGQSYTSTEPMSLRYRS